jgi:hypothetical protein
MGHRTYLEWKHKGDNSMYGKQGSIEDVVGACPARPAWHGKSYTALSPVLGGRHSRPEVGTSIPLSCPLLVFGNETHGRECTVAIIRGQTYRSVRPGKSTNGMPTPRYDVQQLRTTGSPKGRESYGDGVPIVTQGVQPARPSEGGQVTTSRRIGTRDA